MIARPTAKLTPKDCLPGPHPAGVPSAFPLDPVMNYTSGPVHCQAASEAAPSLIDQPHARGYRHLYREARSELAHGARRGRTSGNRRPSWLLKALGDFLHRFLQHLLCDAATL